jgi:hypothetical protein
VCDVVSSLILSTQVKDFFNTLRRWREGGVAFVASRLPPHLLRWLCTISLPTCPDSMATAIPNYPTVNVHEYVCFTTVERIRYCRPLVCKNRSMVLHQLMDGGDGSHMWRVAGINVRGQPRKCGPPGCLFGRGANNSSPQNKRYVRKCYTGRWTTTYHLEGPKQ